MNHKIKRILYCEDDNEIVEASALLFKLILKESNIDRCHNGVQGLKLAKLNKYDLIISDCDMPEMDGIELFNSLDQKERPPFIMCSGRAESHFQSLLPVENFFYLSKPFTTTEFEKILLKLIDNL